MKVQTALSKLLNIDFPIIMAPMFLVSNQKMVEMAMENGIAGAFPSLNFREEGQLEQVIDACHAFNEKHPNGSFGVNIIVKSDNPLAMQHLGICIAKKVPFIITSLGDPTEVVKKVHAYGGKVFCDVTNLKHAKKAANAGCDGFIAVSSAAGGHAGPFPMHLLINSLKEAYPEMPVIAAGGISNGSILHGMIAMGAEGASIGTKFIATHEAAVGEDYKQAVVDAKMDDIVLTRRLSGVPCTVINTPRLQELGVELSKWEGYFFQNPKKKLAIKNFLRTIGLKALEEKLFPNNYQGLYCAGQSVEFIDQLKSCTEIINNYKQEYQNAYLRFKEMN